MLGAVPFFAEATKGRPADLSSVAFAKAEGVRPYLCGRWPPIGLDRGRGAFFPCGR